MLTKQAGLTVAVLLTLAHGTLGAERARNWQMGKVVDIQRSRDFAGLAPPVVQFPGASTDAVYRVYETFSIEGQTYTYLARELLGWPRKPANLTVNGPVKFAVEKRKLYVIDEDGKEHGMEIIKRVLKQPPEQTKPQQP